MPGTAARLMPSSRCGARLEPAFAAGGGRVAAAAGVRPDVGTWAAARDITGAPGAPARCAAAQPDPGRQGPGNGRGGWLSDLLTRASREEAPPITADLRHRPAPRQPTRRERAPRDAVGSLESLSVDIARMIDHEATADLWERYQRGERGLGSQRLYTAQGQKAFEEIRNKYRADPEFRQTVEHYIHEFERLLEEVSRGDRGRRRGAQLPDLRHRQGLHHAGARRRPFRLSPAWRNGAPA